MSFFWFSLFFFFFFALIFFFILAKLHNMINKATHILFAVGHHVFWTSFENDSNSTLLLWKFDDQHVIYGFSLLVFEIMHICVLFWLIMDSAQSLRPSSTSRDWDAFPVTYNVRGMYLFDMETSQQSRSTISSKWFFNAVQGNIARWLKKEGDKVSLGEVLCEVETVGPLYCLFVKSPG